MFNWFKKSRKKGQIESLQEVEQTLNSASYNADSPTTEFQENLKQKLLRARRTNKQQHMETRTHFTFRWKVWVPAVSAAVIILLLIPIIAPMLGQKKLFEIPRAYAQTAFEAEAVQSDSSGVEAKTPFRIKTKVAVTEDELSGKIRFEPEMKFEFKKITETEFEVTPENPLEAGKVYNMVIDAAYQDEKGVFIPKEFRFAFQVKDTFKVLRTVPGDKKDNVPLTTAVEVTFSHQTVKAEDFEKHFSITPKVAGRFEKQGRALVFVPKERLTVETLYSVTISKGLPLADTEQTLASDYNFQFFTSRREYPYYSEMSYVNFNYESRFLSFLPDEKPALRVYLDLKEKSPKEFSVSIYKLSSYEDFKQRSSYLNKNYPDWICYDCVSQDFDTKGLRPAIATTLGDLLPEAVNTKNSNVVITLPKISQRAFYIIEILDNGRKLDQQIFQISDLKAFLVASKTKTLVWVKNAAEQKPEASAKISFERHKAEAVTDDKGIAFFDTPLCGESATYSSSDMSLIKSGKNELILRLDQSCGLRKTDTYYWGVNFDYWTTFSTDRGIYLPEDTVNFWGVAKKRKNPAPETFKLELRTYDYDQPIATATVKTSDFGTFTGKFDLRSVPPRFYEIYLINEKGERVLTGGIEVATFQKPLYEIKVSVDKSAVYYGEKLTATAKVKFFDGTPAAGIELNARVDGREPEQKIKTDKNGEASVVIDTSKFKRNEEDDRYFSSMMWKDVQFSPVKAEAGLSTGYVSYVVFLADMDMSLENDYKKQTKEKAVINGKIRGIDINKWNSGNWSEDYYTYGIADYNIDVEIFRTVEDKIENGEYYDPITKQVQKNYRYERRDESINKYSSTTGSNGGFKVEFTHDNKSEYRVKVTAKDSKGRIFLGNTYVYSRGFDYSAYTAVKPEDSYGALYLTDLKKKVGQYNIGEKVVLDMMVRNDEGEDKLFQGKGDFIFMKMQSGIMDFVQTDKPKYEFSFEEKHMPNVEVFYVFFNGKAFRNSGSNGGWANIIFDNSKKKIDIEIKTAKEFYRPGQEAEIEVFTKNAGGKPISAEVNINLVDEAVYAIRESYDDPLISIYRNVDSGVLTIATTASSLDAGFGEGKGGGGAEGEGEIRRVFKNTAYFGTVKTDSSGHAAIKAKLPDDLTTYRITAQAVSENLEAGIQKSKITTTMPFFAEVTMNEIYLASDQPQIRLRSFGTELKDDGEIVFNVSIPSLGETGKEIKIKGGEEYWYALPALNAGTHEITVRAKYGNYKDAIAKKIKVVEGLLTLPVSETRMLAEGNSLSSYSAKSAKLVFSLSPYGEYYEQLENLKWGYWGRLDSKISSQASKNLLAQYFGESVPENENKEDLSSYQHSVAGGLQLMPYGDVDLDVSYRAALFADQNFDKIKLEQYFDKVLEDSKSNREELAMALAGKAAVKLPVLNELKMFLNAQKSSMKAREKLVVAFGLTALGDNGEAAALLDEVMKGVGREEGDALILELTRDREEDLELTALAGAVAAMTSHSEAPKLWKASIRYQTTRTLTSLEKLIMLDAFLKHLPPIQEGNFRYTVGGRSEKVTLKLSQTSSLFISQDDFKNLSFSDLKGPVSVTVYYDAPFESTQKKLSSTVRVSRFYEVQGKHTTTLEEGQLVKVVLKPEVSGEKDSNGYEVIDTLPAGLLPLAQTVYNYYDYGKGGSCGYSCFGSPYEVFGQRVSFKYYSGEKEISYMARVVSKGKFKAEPVLIQSVSNVTRMNISQPAEIEIR